MLKIVLCSTLAVLAAQAQSFDVASIKPAEPIMNGMIRIGISGGPGTNDPGRINYNGVPMKMILTNAFDVKGYQIVAPSWVDSERYDITAKVPQGTTKEQSHVMMRNLLADRFKMTFHREKKEMASFVLVAAKGGAKLKAAEPEKPKDPDAPAGGPELKGPPPGGFKLGKDGFPDIPAGGGRGGPMMIMMPGRAKLTCTACTVAQLLDRLGSQVDKPIVDETGLTGKYDFTLIFEPEMRGMPMMAGGRGPGGPPPGAVALAGPAADGPAPKGDDEPAPAFMTALQEQLGLRLEPRKAPVDLVVVDHLEKVATEN